MNSDENLHEWISRYNEGTLEGNELERFLEILKSDPEVRIETDLDKELTEFLKDGDLLAFLKVVDEVRLKRRRGVGMNTLLMAAVMLILIAIGSFWIYRYTLKGLNRFPITFSQGRNTPQYLGDTQSGSIFLNRTSPGYPGLKWIKEGMDIGFPATNFTPLPYLEGLVGIAMRATNLSLLSPAFSIRINPGDTVTFQWMRTGTPILSIEIIDNLGNRLWTFAKLNGRELDLNTSQWKAGLYYWKLLTDDDIVYVGKITVIEQEK